MTTKQWSYAHTGWSAHSGAGTGKRNWWLALYEDGHQVDYLKVTKYGGGVRHFSYEGAKKRAQQLNKELGIEGSQP